MFDLFVASDALDKEHFDMYIFGYLVLCYR